MINVKVFTEGQAIFTFIIHHFTFEIRNDSLLKRPNDGENFFPNHFDFRFAKTFYGQ